MGIGQNLSILLLPSRSTPAMSTLFWHSQACLKAGPREHAQFQPPYHPISLLPPATHSKNPHIMIWGEHRKQSQTITMLNAIQHLLCFGNDLRAPRSRALWCVFKFAHSSLTPDSQMLETTCTQSASCTHWATAL